MFSKEPLQVTAQMLHGLVSNSEWTGVPLSVLLDEAGIDPAAKWLVAEGADGQMLDRSVPVKKAYEDALVAIYQNGEHLMPGNGYPNGGDHAVGRRAIRNRLISCSTVPSPAGNVLSSWVAT